MSNHSNSTQTGFNVNVKFGLLRVVQEQVVGGV